MPPLNLRQAPTPMRPRTTGTAMHLRPPMTTGTDLVTRMTMRMITGITTITRIRTEAA